MVHRVVKIQIPPKQLSTCTHVSFLSTPSFFIQVTKKKKKSQNAGCNESFPKNFIVEIFKYIEKQKKKKKESNQPYT